MSFFNNNAVNSNFFVTGTDTEVGKTFISCKILEYWKSLGYKTLGIKPVSSGHTLINGNMVNEDAYLLRKFSTQKLSLDQVNPFTFPEFIAPHIAAKMHDVNLNVENIFSSIKSQLDSHYDYCIVEGCGGWYVPINNSQTMADFAKKLNFPVLLVVSIKLGCINHAILTFNNIMLSGLKFHGWVANCIDNMQDDVRLENINSISSFIGKPLSIIQ